MIELSKAWAIVKSYWKLCNSSFTRRVPTVGFRVGLRQLRWMDFCFMICGAIALVWVRWQDRRASGAVSGIGV